MMLPMAPSSSVMNSSNVEEKYEYFNHRDTYDNIEELMKNIKLNAPYKYSLRSHKNELILPYDSELIETKRPLDMALINEKFMLKINMDGQEGHDVFTTRGTLVVKDDVLCLEYKNKKQTSYYPVLDETGSKIALSNDSRAPIVVKSDGSLYRVMSYSNSEEPVGRKIAVYDLKDMEIDKKITFVSQEIYSLIKDDDSKKKIALVKGDVLKPQYLRNFQQYQIHKMEKIMKQLKKCAQMGAIHHHDNKTHDNIIKGWGG